jgi:hypothetical protein
MRRLIPVVVLASAAVAGCGGSATAYSAGPTRTCLKAAGATVDPDGWDYISKTARGGSYGVRVAGNFVAIGFFGTSNDAKRAIGAYSMFGDAANAPTDDVLSRHGNVTLSWDNTPTSHERSVIEGCLK